MDMPYRILTLGFLIVGCQAPKEDTSNEDVGSAVMDANTIVHQTTDLLPDSTFTSGVEGPAVFSDGTLYAVNGKVQGTIGRVSPPGEFDIFVTLPDSSIGNGIRFTSQGDMLVADYVSHNILKINMQDRSIAVWVHQPGMNQPNDLAITRNDIVFASDPHWGNSTGQLWRINKDGSTTLLEENMGTTNGVEVSADEKTLYVNESVQRKVWAYDLSEDGVISNKRLLLEFNDYGLDGMRCDARGNLYLTRYGKGEVLVVSPEGAILKNFITKGKNTTNIAFGGEDGKTCYVTVADRGTIETFRADYPGRSWAMRH